MGQEVEEVVYWYITSHTHTLKYECYKSPILFSSAGWLVGSMVGAILRPISECTERERAQVTNNQKRKKLLARSFVISLAHKHQGHQNEEDELKHKIIW